MAASQSKPTLAMPPIGLGTSGSAGDIGLDAMLAALELGYRHIDTAQVYGNEDKVGAAIERSGLGREAVYVTTKIHPFSLEPAALKESMLGSLDKLRTDYVDLALIHWPSKDNAVPMGHYIEALLDVQARGQARQVGLSNFTVALVEEAVSIAGPGSIANNQVEVHPFLQNRKLRQRCQELGVSVTGYMPVAGGAVRDDAVIGAIAERHRASPAQVAISWLLANGMVAIPSSKSRAHLAENLAAAKLSLTDADMSEIAQLDRGMRIIDPPTVAPQWD